MKKTIALAIALLMALTLAACGGNNDAPSGGDTPPPTSNTPSDTDTPIPTPTDNTQPSETPTPDDSGTPSVSGAEIPDNGTPPDAPAPFETHPGDRGYFFADTDDYAVLMYDPADERNNKAAAFGPCVQYYVMSFDETDHTSRFNKWVFENETDAQAYAASGHNLLTVGNVVYRDFDPDMPQEALQLYGKEGHVRGMVSTTWQFGGEVYLSVPQGFDELLADTSIKGRTGSMTLREAFADAGFTALPDGPDYDSTNFILTFGYDDYFEMTTASAHLFDGETATNYISFFLFDDPSSAPKFTEATPLSNTKSDYLEYLPQQTRGAGRLCYVGI